MAMSHWLNQPGIVVPQTFKVVDTSRLNLLEDAAETVPIGTLTNKLIGQIVSEYFHLSKQVKKK